MAPKRKQSLHFLQRKRREKVVDHLFSASSDSSSENTLAGGSPLPSSSHPDSSSSPLADLVPQSSPSRSHPNLSQNELSDGSSDDEETDDDVFVDTVQHPPDLESNAGLPTNTFFSSDSEFEDAEEVGDSSQSNFDDAADAYDKAPLFEPTRMQKLRENLRIWALMCNITLLALTKLLHLLKLCDEDYFKDLPADGRTVLQTPRVTNVRPVPPGEYYHIGLKKQLLSALANLSSVPESLKLVFNIDGLKVHKYTKFELWPFLMKIVDIPILKHCINPIGMYYGKGKGTIHDFLQEFMEKLTSLQETGLMFRDVVIRIEVIGFICDAPAKCYLLGVKGQGGFCSCTRCQIHGFTYEGRRVFLESDCEARTDADFRNGVDREFQPDGCSTPLVNIRGLDMVKSIVIDTMHLIFLGIVRTLVDAWYNGPKPFKLSSNLRGRFSQDLFSSQVYVPKEFPRKPKDLSSGAHWKATESRTFLLHVGPALVKKYLDNDKYHHSLLLHSAMTILLSPIFCQSKEMLQKAKMSLQDFVESTPPLYSEAFVTHNIHNLLHLVDDVEHFSQFFQSFSLNDISYFPFENYLQCIKNLARGTAKTLQQIARRLHEIMKCVDLAREKARKDSIYAHHPEQKHSQGPLLPGCSDPQYKSIKFSDFTMSRQMPDNCCLLKNDSVVLTDNFAWSDEYNEMVIIGKRYLRKENLYETPHLQSSDLSIFKVERLSDIKAKCARFPLDEVTSAVFPLLHSDHAGPESLGLEL